MSMNPYRIVEETDTHVTYEYRTAYTWLLYAGMIVLLAGMALSNQAIETAGMVLVGLYFVAKVPLSLKVNEKIRQAMASKAVQISGSRSSFSNPLRIRIPK
jgi:hypothetical protein